MYKPPLSTFLKVSRDPMQPPGAKIVAANQTSNGYKVYECPTVKKPGQGVEKKPRVQLIDHRKVRLEGRNIDRRKELVNTPSIELSTIGAIDNPEFETELETAKEHTFWVFPHECTDVFMNKKSGLAYANVCIIGINGRQWPLFPGNNKAPGFVYEALETKRELNKRYKEKIAPPIASGKSINFSNSKSAFNRMQTNSNIFNDSMLGRPNHFDSSINSQASQLIRQARTEALKKGK